MNKVKQYRKKLILISAAVFIILFKSYVMNRVIVAGDSMESSYKHGDIVWVEKITKYNRIDRFDVVIVKIKGETIIKRVIGLPNETVLIADGKIYIDGENLKEEKEVYINDGGIAAEPFHLSDNEYFMLGDNRNASRDSREIGAVYISQIIGKPIFRFFPLNRIDRLY